MREGVLFLELTSIDVILFGSEDYENHNEILIDRSIPLQFGHGVAR